MWPLLRVAIGCIFLVSGLEKLLSPYQNFLYVIQAYQIMPSWVETLTAQIFPWVEFLTGVFVVLGLWTPWALRAALVLFACFIVVVGQALLRGIPLDNCGCFGELIHFKPSVIIVMDSGCFLLIVTLLRFLPKVKRLSLDAYFEK